MLDPISVSLLPANCVHPCTCELPGSGFLGFNMTFWTSTAYLVAVMAIYFQARVKHFKLEYWVFAGTLLSSSSMLFHSLYLNGTLALDFASITMALSFFSLYRFASQKLKKKWLLETTFFLSYLLLWLFFLYMDKNLRIGLSVFIFGLAAIEAINQMRERSKKQNQWLVSSLMVLLTSFACFILEELRWWCSPYFSAHSVWHLGSALSLYLYGRWRFIK